MKAQTIDPVAQKTAAVKRQERLEQDRKTALRLKAFTAHPKKPAKPKRSALQRWEERAAKRHKSLFLKRHRKLIDLAFRTRGFKRRDRFDLFVGLDLLDFRARIESLFLPGMNWVDREKWRIGYAVPLHLAQTSAELRALHHYSNARPVWSSDKTREGSYPLTLPGYITPEIRAIWQRAQEI